MGRDTFIVRKSYKNRFQRWGAKKGYAILMAMFEYEETGEVNLPEEYLDAFDPIREDLAAYDEAYERRCRINAINGAKGGKAKKANATDCQQTQTNLADIDIDNDIDIKKEKILKRKKFVKPTLDEVIEYCAERNNMVVPQRFYDYYESNGWMVGKNKMKDWKAAVRTWETNGTQRKPQSKVAPYMQREVKPNPRFGMEYL